jgi:predicted alpha/beta-fold hydrolase
VDANTATALMAAGYNAIAMDLRGDRQCAWSPYGAYKINDFALNLLALPEQLKETPALVGASLGGLAGLIAKGNFVRDHSLR